MATRRLRFIKVEESLPKISSIFRSVKDLTSSEVKFANDAARGPLKFTERKIGAIVGQTTFKHLLSRGPNSADEKERDKESFNIFKNSVHGGTAYPLIGSALKDFQGKPRSS